MTKNYKDMPPEQRFEELAKMAEEFFGVTTWRGKFAERYDMSAQQLSAWAKSAPAAPVWALVAISDALDARRMEIMREWLKG